MSCSALEFVHWEALWTACQYFKTMQDLANRTYSGHFGGFEYLNSNLYANYLNGLAIQCGFRSHTTQNI